MSPTPNRTPAEKPSQQTLLTGLSPLLFLMKGKPPAQIVVKKILNIATSLKCNNQTIILTENLDLDWMLCYNITLLLAMLNSIIHALGF